jgi:hypothetical protein
LLDGAHSIKVYASDPAGNVGSSNTVYFTVDTTPPSIMLLSPQNQTYTTTEMTLDVTLNENASWTGYSLDGKGTVTVTGNLSLTDLAYGSHSVTVYANDTYGNMVASETIFFSVSEPFPTLWVAVLTAMIAGSGLALLLYFKRPNRATKKLKLEEQMLPS